MKQRIKQLISTTALLSLLIAHPLQADTRIVGGTTVSINDFPSTVALLSTATLTHTGSAFQAQICGGTLIQSTWVLTAAHCVVKRDGDTIDVADLSVLAGTGNLNNPNYAPIAIARIIVHEAYNNVLFGEDIALIELERAANAPAIALTESKALSNDYAYIAGWGMLEHAEDPDDARFPTRLQAATVRIVTGTDCASLGGMYTTVDADKQICAGIQGGGVDTCQGDSGGPLFVVTKLNTLRLGGITSWGDECARANKPGVYTDVFHYRNWILNTIDGVPTGPIQTSSTLGSVQVVDTNPTNNQAVEVNPMNDQTGEQYRERLTVSGSASYPFVVISIAILGLRRATRSAILLK